MKKTILALRHIHFEDLGSLQPAFESAGYVIQYCDMAIDQPARIADPDVLVILGGPVAAYDTEHYPFLLDELELIRARLTSGRPTLGICLGAQLMARALGARVYPMPVKEIGWASLTLSRREEEDVLAPLQDRPVLHWHGDTFDLPTEAVCLASTAACRNQAFSFEQHALALQFHLEVMASRFEHWLIGHANEISSVPDISAPLLRAATSKNASALETAAKACLSRWIAQLP